MKKIKILAFILVIALIAVSAAMFVSCKDKDENENVLGKGKTSFKLEVTDDKGVTKTFTIKTDEKTVGDALMHSDVKLIGIDDEWGMVDTVNGLKADYLANGSYWAFYINGEYASVGVFDAEIEKDAKYGFNYEIDNGDWEDYDDGEAKG